MKEFSLKVQSRETSGRRASRHARRDGQIPAVIYGKETPQGLMIDSKTFANLYKQVAGITAIIKLEADKGAEKLALLQEVQRDRLTDAFKHIDFLEIRATEPMRARLNVKTTGESIGVKMENAILEVVYPQIEVRCLPKDLPDFIEVDVSGLHAEDAIFMRDIKRLTVLPLTRSPTRWSSLVMFPRSRKKLLLWLRLLPKARPLRLAPMANRFAPAAGAAAPAADAKAAAAPAKDEKKK
jgi:large subunit ribosomal protein L25